MKRREFIKYSVLLLGSSAFASDLKFYSYHINIIQEPFQSISHVLEQLFPPNIAMPSVHSFNVVGFLKALMQDPRVKNETKQILQDGVKWLNQTSQNSYMKNYKELTLSQKEKLLQQISQKQWGDTWLWYLMNYSFEAMFSDPVYGANSNKIGWKWVEYESGLPRPPKVNAYV
ncbi:MAG: gluconate 2-dehydrogenase subunit 3 family protein [Thiovulaceae bacterium]|nr:gluconate 2-dehydrogenase subunit 3 family protein [Sulfurimonadaceae bacterium]